ncbi:hypothetical protein F2Q70_00006830 [Brassica cretica]|uniref:Uncharacterized protein n=1 Tax=Brassica cretica TaxID=69181 RepID=A0A8S9IVU3_BRACR|nr:hypothetical protein F2Q68_00023500 [Brassica cretica]KAF2574060.1 hypothetical protein F2Q70_00006830 [Brassica cretica]
MLYAMLFGCFFYPTDKNPFVSSEFLHEEFREIHGDPVYDVYDDESQIQVEDIVNDNHGQENVVEIGLHVVEDVDPIIHVYDEAYMLGDVYGEEDAKTIDYIFGDKVFETGKRSATFSGYSQNQRLSSSIPIKLPLHQEAIRKTVISDTSITKHKDSFSA